jgi:hypothetical protein
MCDCITDWSVLPVNMFTVSVIRVQNIYQHKQNSLTRPYRISGPSSMLLNSFGQFFPAVTVIQPTKLKFHTFFHEKTKHYYHIPVIIYVNSHKSQDIGNKS